MAGRGGPNLLWTDAALHGVVFQPGGRRDINGALQWLNAGGDKVWPTAQAEFEALNGVAWPPDPWFDGSPFQSRLLPDGVEIVGPVSPHCGARYVREIRLAPTGSRLVMRQRVEKVRTVAGSPLEPISLTVWNVTQVRPPEHVMLPLPTDGAAHVFPEFPVKDLQIVTNNNTLVIAPGVNPSGKFGARSDGWLAAVIDSTLFVQRFDLDPRAAYPDGGLSAEVYTSGAYTELEVLGPFKAAAPGAAAENTVTWELHDLPAAATPHARRAAALALLGATD